MGESIGKVVAMILAISLLIMYPLGDVFQHKDDLSYLITFNSTTKLVDTVREKGYMSNSMYQSFLNEIAVTGNVYDIEITHLHSIDEDRSEERPHR